MQITYESIQHLIVKTTISGDSLTCEFSDPQYPEVLKSTVSVSNIVGAKSRMKTSLVREIRSTIASFLSNLFRQLLGQLAGDSLARVSDQGLRTNYSEVSLVRGDKRKAIIMAFERVSTNFRFDQASEKFSRIR